MKLRTKLVLAFCLLAVVPLSAIVVFSYLSSIRSLRQAVLTENYEVAAEMSDRLVVARDGVTRSLGRLGDPEVARLMAEADSPDDRERLARSIQATMGSLAPYVEALEFVPAQPASSPDAPSEAPAGGPVVVWMNRVADALREAQLKVETDTPGEAELVRAFLGELSSSTEDLGRRIAASAARLAEIQRRRAPEAAPGAEEPHEVHELRVVRERGALESDELAALESRRVEADRILGRRFALEIEDKGVEVGRLEASVSAERLLRGVLALSRREKGEIPFAVDAEGSLFVADDSDREKIADMPLARSWKVSADNGAIPDDWVLVRIAEPESGLTLGIARPIRESLIQLRRTAGRNFALGLGLVGLALAGVVPLSRRITRDLGELTAGARALAEGHLDARVAVRSTDEVGELAHAFNRMAGELESSRTRLLEEERLRKEHEIERRLLEAENRRKSAELEEARRFQLSLLPKEVPEVPGLELAVLMRTATEVGGDYYDFHRGDDGVLTVAIGDATGHGARAGTMVTVIKSLFTAQGPGPELTGFLDDAARAIGRMELGRMAMALALARLDGDLLTVAAAGMPPVLIHRHRSGAVDELSVEGVPLGAMAGSTYRQRQTRLEAGDTVLLMSDGYPELPDAEGEPFGYTRVREAFEKAAGEPPDACIERLAQSAEAWTEGGPPADDITFVALRFRPA